MALSGAARAMTRLFVIALLLGLLVAAVAWRLDPRYGGREAPTQLADPLPTSAPAAPGAPWHL